MVVLRYYKGLSDREIADVLSCKPGTVREKHSCYDPWRVDDGTLSPLGFRYQVPPTQPEDA